MGTELMLNEPVSFAPSGVRVVPIPPYSTFMGVDDKCGCRNDRSGHVRTHDCPTLKGDEKRPLRESIKRAARLAHNLWLAKEWAK